MVIVLKNNPDKKQVESLYKWLNRENIAIHEIRGTQSTVLGLVGDTSGIEIELIQTLDIVESETESPAATRADAPAPIVNNIITAKTAAMNLLMEIGTPFFDMTPALP